MCMKYKTGFNNIILNDLLLKENMNDHDLSREIYAQLGFKISFGTIRKLRLGLANKPRMDTIMVMSEFFKVPLDFFLNKQPKSEKSNVNILRCLDKTRQNISEHSGPSHLKSEKVLNLEPAM